MVSQLLHGAYQRRVFRRGLILGGLGLACLGCVFAELAIGSGTLPLRAVLMALLHPHQAGPVAQAIIWQLRLPVVLTTVIAGAGLAISGMLMQSTLRNPLAEPFTLGLSSAAGFGAAMAIIYGGTLAWTGLSADVLVSGSAFIIALSAAFGISAAARWQHLEADTIALLGIAVHFTFSSLLAFSQYLANADQLQSLIFWLLGSVQRTSWMQVAIDAALLALVLPFLLLRTWMLTAIETFGEDATALGIKVERLRRWMLIAAALLAASVTATVGIIGFVGLVAPHIARQLTGNDQRFSLAATAACGILIMTTAAIASETLIPGVVLPVGMLTALLGVPFFLIQILRQRGTHA